MFLDELLEFKRTALEVMWQPLGVELQNGESLRRAAKLGGCSLGVAQKVKRLMLSEV